MESDLFGGSLGKKTTPNKPTKSTKTKEPKKINTDNEQPPGVDPTRAKTSSPSSAKSMLLPVGIDDKNYNNINNVIINCNNLLISNFV